MEYLIRLLFSLAITIYIIKRAYRKKSLSYSGCLAAFFVGTIVTYSNFCHLAALLAFFFFSNKATKFRQNVKIKYDEEFKEGGQRDAFQVFSNGFFATFYSALYLIDCGYGERPIDFILDYKATWYSLAIISSLACCCGDTFSSELGIAFNYNQNKVLHIIKLKKVPKGTNGGVTVIGILASILGGFLVGLGFYLVLKFYFLISPIDTQVPQWPVLIICTLSGFFGSLIDSVLGGYFQYSGLNKKTDKVTNKPGENIEHISGYDLLNNNQVNWLSCMIISFIVPYFSFKLYKYL